jgi:hypothetical protein
MRNVRTLATQGARISAVGRNLPARTVYAPQWKAGPWRNERANRRPRRTTGRASS